VRTLRAASMRLSRVRISSLMPRPGGTLVQGRRICYCREVQSRPIVYTARATVEAVSLPALVYRVVKIPHGPVTPPLQFRWAIQPPLS
jgi:hypothetical protein